MERSQDRLPGLLAEDVFGAIRRARDHWDLELTEPLCRTFRIHFDGLVESRCTTPSFSRVSLHDEHRLLADHREPLFAISLGGLPGNPSALMFELMQQVRDWSGGWRTLREYVDTSDPLALLSAGEGALMTVPASLFEIVRPGLERHGATPRHEERPAMGRTVQALCIGPNFVVARGFAFEER